MKHVLCVALCFASLHVASTRVAAAINASNASGLTLQEQQRETALRKRLCAKRELNCDYVNSIFTDSRLTIYTPPEPAPAPSAPAPKTRERNPYLTERFGLLTSESLERCRSFIEAHALTFDAAYELYGVPREIVCGHLRIETDFGIPTRLSVHPFGALPAVNRLISMYVRKPVRARRASSFAHRQKFALDELAMLLAAATANGWELFDIPGSPTGAIGLSQFEPSAFSVAVDGNGDGKIDLFEPEDAILSVAHYLVTRGWDSNPEHQKRAVYAYYGGRYNRDPNKFYMKAVLSYAAEVRSYLQDHPVERSLTFFVEPPAPQSTDAALPSPGDAGRPPTN